MRSRSLYGEVGFLPEHGAFGGLQRVGPQRRPADVPGAELPARRFQPGSEGGFGGLPGGFFRRLGGVDQGLGLAEGPSGERRLEGQEGFRAAARLAVLVDAVEEGREGVVVGLGDGVELVRVALRAAEREPEPRRAHGVHAV